MFLAIIGGVVTFFIFVGAPEAVQKPGAPIQPPDPTGMPPATAQIERVNRQTVFRELLADPQVLTAVRIETVADDDDPARIVGGPLGEGAVEDDCRRVGVVLTQVGHDLAAILSSPTPSNVSSLFIYLSPYFLLSAL